MLIRAISRSPERAAVSNSSDTKRQGLSPSTCRLAQEGRGLIPCPGGGRPRCRHMGSAPRHGVRRRCSRPEPYRTRGPCPEQSRAPRPESVLETQSHHHHDSPRVKGVSPGQVSSWWKPGVLGAALPLQHATDLTPDTSSAQKNMLQAALKLLDQLQKMLAAEHSRGSPSHRQTHAPLFLPFSSTTSALFSTLLIRPAPHRSNQPCFAFPATEPTTRDKYHQLSSKIFFQAEMGALQQCVIETSQFTGVYCLGRAVEPTLFYLDILPVPGNRYLYSRSVLTRLGAWILMDQAHEQQAGRFLFPLLPADSHAQAQAPAPRSVSPGCSRRAPMLGRVLQPPLPSSPAPWQGKEAQKIPLPTHCSLPLSEMIRIN